VILASGGVDLSLPPSLKTLLVCWPAGGERKVSNKPPSRKT